MTAARRLYRALPLLFLAVVAGGCWIPLPEETAIVVEVFDSLGRPVDGVNVNVDGGIYVTGENVGNEGRVFRSLSSAGSHTVGIETASLLDPQGGRRYVPVASLVSGETRPLSYAQRPFAGENDAIIVPVAKGFISVVTIHLADALQAPADNQWLTDGNIASDWRGVENGQGEFSTRPAPTFWWRTDPSMGASVLTTFQLWKDADGDTRYPMGVRDIAGYMLATDPGGTGYIPPIWQIPNAGLQRAEGMGGGRVRLWAGEAVGTVGTIRYDVFYAITSNWHATLENNPFLSDLVLSPGSTPGTVVVELGPGTANDGVLFRNGLEYRFALRARDAASNAEELRFVTAPTTRRAVPRASATLGSVSAASVVDTDSGGKLSLSYQCSASQPVRVYAAPVNDWINRPFDPRYVRGIDSCTVGANAFTLEDLVSRQAVAKAPVSYMVAFEPFDAAGNVGGASTLMGTPTSGSSIDTVQPYWENGGAITATTGSQPRGQVLVTFDTVSDPSGTAQYLRRLYYGPSSLALSNIEARAHTDIRDKFLTELAFGQIPNDVWWYFAIQAVDDHGNASTVKATQVILRDPLNRSGPRWSTDTQSLFYSLGYPTAGTVTHPLGVAYDYDGPALATSEDGEYVWRIVQDDGSAQRAESKLGAFYTWSGFYYATTASGGLQMANPSTQVRQRDVFNFVEQSLSGTSVMGAYFDSNATAGFRQRTVRGLSAMLEGGSNEANQLVLRYVTDADGVVMDAPFRDGNEDKDGALLEVTAVNSQYVGRVPRAYPPHLQSKTFLAFYRQDTDRMFPFPNSALGVVFSGSLATPDAMDPEW